MLELDILRICASSNHSNRDFIIYLHFIFFLCFNRHCSFYLLKTFFLI